MFRKYKVTQNKFGSKEITLEKTFFTRKNAEKYFDKIHDVNNKDIITTLSRLDKK